MLLPDPGVKPEVPVPPETVHAKVVPATVGKVLSAIALVVPLQKFSELGVATTEGTGFTVQLTELVFELQPLPLQFLLVSMIVVVATPDAAEATMDGIEVPHEDHVTPLSIEERNSSAQVPVPPLPLTTLTESVVPAQTGLVLGVLVRVGASGSGTTEI